MRLQHHLESLQSSADTLANLSYAHPTSFQNTLLRQVPITQVIRDAEPHESSLFTPSATKKSSSARTEDDAAADVLRDREAPLPVLLRAVEQIVHHYPIDQDAILRRVEVMRVKGDTLTQSIATLERHVDEQRRKLDDLSVGRSFLDTEQQQQQQQGDAGHGEVTEEMILAEEEEIARLEQVIEQKSSRR